MRSTAASRRPARSIRILVIAIGLVAFLAALRTERANAAPQPAATANSFIESMGVATHFTYTDTAYGRFAELKSRLAELGIHHIREDLLPNRPDQIQKLNELASAGIGSTLIMGSPENSIATLENLLGIVRTKLTKVDALEGPNEYYLSGRSNWTSLADSYQAALYEKAKANPATANIPVLGPTTIFWQNGELGNISNYLDYGTIHPYPGGYPEEEYESRHIEFAARSSAAKPVVATETGYHNAMNSNDGHPPVSEAAAATYMPRVYLSSFEQGVKRTFVYELVDEQPNPQMDNIEDHFGLLRNDLTPKPAFTAIANLTTILHDPGAEFTPGSVDYTVTGNTEKLHQVLLQKRDGTFYLALWRATSVWNPTAKTPIEPGSPSLAIRFNTPLSSVQAYSPNVSPNPTTEYGKTQAVALNVGPQVTILKLNPSTGVGAEEAPTPIAEEAQPPVEVPPVAAPAPVEEAPVSVPVTEPVSTDPGAGTPVSSPVAIKPGSGNGSGSGPVTAPAEKSTKVPPVRTHGPAKVWVEGHRKGHRVYLHGGVAVGGASEIAVQEQSNRGWKTIGHSRTSSAGTFELAVELGSTGTRPVNLRVAAPGARPSAPLVVPTAS